MKTPRMQQIEAMLAQTPDDQFLRYGLAMEYVSAEDHASAARVFAELIAQPGAPYVPAYLMAGQVHQRLGNEAQAAEVLRQGIAAAKAAGNDHACSEMEALLAIVE